MGKKLVHKCNISGVEGGKNVRNQYPWSGEFLKISKPDFTVD